MSGSRRVTVMFSVLLASALIGSVLLLRRVDQLRTGATLEEVLYISSPQALKRLSLGYNGLLADIYWTRAVQYYGNKHHEGARRFDLLAPLLEITTALDPQLLVAYEYGANFLAPKPPNGAGMPERAIALEEFGIRNNPDAWQLYYNAGFIHYMELKDYAGAAEAFARGAQRAQRPSFSGDSRGQDGGARRRPADGPHDVEHQLPDHQRYQRAGQCRGPPAGPASRRGCHQPGSADHPLPAADRPSSLSASPSCRPPACCRARPAIRSARPTN